MSQQLYPSEYPSYWYHQHFRSTRPVIVKNAAQVESLGEDWGPLPWKDPFIAPAPEPTVTPMVRPGAPQPGERIEQTGEIPAVPSGAPHNADPGATLGQVLPPPPSPAQAAVLQSGTLTPPPAEPAPAPAAPAEPAPVIKPVALPNPTLTAKPKTK
jgi:hypothetical protein